MNRLMSLAIVAIVALAAPPTRADSLAWIRQLGSAETDYNYGVSADGTGNVYIAGYTGSNLGGPNAGVADAFVAKYDASGNRLWVRQLGTTEFDNCFGVSADDLGNVYISGGTAGDLGRPHGREWDAYVAKYDAGGNLQWTKQLGTDATEWSQSVSADGLGNVYISGYTFGNLDGPNLGLEDAFVSKFDAAGNLQWTRQLGSSTKDESWGVSADGLGNVYITGETFGVLVGPDSGTVDAFISKYDAAGNLEWTRQPESPGTDDWGTGVSVDRLGNVYLSGYHYLHNYGVDFGAFVIKYDAAGNIQWTRAPLDGGAGVSADGLGNVYVTGSGLVSEYDATGGLQGLITIPKGDRAHAVSADRLGNVFISGDYGYPSIWRGTFVAKYVIPEPASCLLAALGSAAVLCIGKRRN